MPRHHGFRFGALIPALVVGGVKRLHDRAVEAGHIHDSVIGTDIALISPCAIFFASSIVIAATPL